jgi:hypothetical protein
MNPRYVAQHALLGQPWIESELHSPWPHQMNPLMVMEDCEFYQQIVPEVLGSHHPNPSSSDGEEVT